MINKRIINTEIVSKPLSINLSTIDIPIKGGLEEGAAEGGE